MELQLELKNNLIKWLLIIIAIFLILSFFSLLAFFLFENKYAGKIYPGIFIGKENLSGLTKNKAVKLINDRVDSIKTNGVIFNLDGNKMVMNHDVASLDSEVAYEIFNFDVNKTVNDAYTLGRSGNFFTDTVNKIIVLTKGKKINATYFINANKARKNLAEYLSGFENLAQDAKLTYTYNEKNDTYQFSVSPEKNGEAIDYDAGINQLEKNLTDINNSPINLTRKKDEARIFAHDCINIEKQANAFLDKAPFTIKFNDGNKKISKNILVDWLALKINEEKNGDKIIVALNQELVKEYLNDEIGPLINKKARDAKFEFVNGKVVKFQSSQDGIEIDLEASATKIDDELKNNNKEIELILKVTKSSIDNTNVNDLGIKEIIGTGESNFAGSPNNRRHNIKNGADTLSGILIKPNEEFSTLGALGEIDGSTGYLQELVIKQGKTIPEYGGGLCQIGTTMFRTALASGLPITMRRNHSYRVQYYEPAGTDATIYDPWPDFKFKNDTGNHILIQYRIEGDNLFFDFWGTRDGRTATTTYPKIYNIIKPKPTKIIESLDLKPGEKKCTERAHNGADAYFDYTVAYANGEIKEERFTSHYVPWQEVCLLGVEKLSADETATSTPTTNNEELAPPSNSLTN